LIDDPSKRYLKKALFHDISQRRLSVLLRGGADGRFEDSAPCRSPFPHGGFGAINLTALRGNSTSKREQRN